MGKTKDVHNLVQKAYADVARKQSSCCDPKMSCCNDTAYTVPDHPVPEAELGLSCGNPVAFSHLKEGDVVLDLGSGAGKDVFLAAQKVGDGGRAIGVDMTPEMLALARKNAVKFYASTGLANVEFREGKIESLPVEDASVDVVISNCVINLSPDKPQVFREVFRVLKPGGRMIVSDIVLNRPLPESARSDADLYAACIAGALLREEYLDAIRRAGFARVELLSDHTYAAKQVGGDPITAEAGATLEGIAASIAVLAQKDLGRNRCLLCQAGSGAIKGVLRWMSGRKARRCLP
jgi:ubiquinone/menaquinone biosynthesis C-methylase UbiE